MSKINQNELIAAYHANAQQYAKALDRAAYGTMVVGDDLGDALGTGVQAGSQALSGNYSGAGGTLGGAIGGAIGGDTGQAVGQLAGQLGGAAIKAATSQGSGSSQQKQTLVMMAEDHGLAQDPKRQGIYAARAGQPGTAYYVPKGATARSGHKTAQGTWSSAAITNAPGSPAVPAGFYFIPATVTADMAGAMWTAGSHRPDKSTAQNNLHQLLLTLAQKYGVQA